MPSGRACSPATSRAGDRIIGLRSPGLRCNGYSLARAALLGRAGRDLASAAWPGAHHTLADELLLPSTIYAPTMVKLAAEVPVHAFAHITGGGIPGNLVRVLPDRCDAVVTRGDWDEPRIFAEIQQAGSVSDEEMENVFNLGLGMLAVVPVGDAFHAVDIVRAAGHDAWLVGEVVDGHGRVRLERRRGDAGSYCSQCARTQVHWEHAGHVMRRLNGRLGSGGSHTPIGRFASTKSR